MTDKQIRDRIVGVLSASMMPMEMEAECVAFLDRSLKATQTIENLKRLLLNVAVTGKEPCDICANVHPIPDDCDCDCPICKRSCACAGCDDGSKWVLKENAGRGNCEQ